MTAPVSAVPATRQEVPRLADDYSSAVLREIRQVAHRAPQPLQLLLGNIITCGQRCAWVGCGGRCVCCGF